MALLISNATVVTLTDLGLLNDHAIYIEDDAIVALGPTVDLEAKYADAEVINANGALVMPGGICAHTHFYGAFARGMAIPGPAPKDFPEILERLWWSLDKALDPDSVRLSAQTFMIDAIKHGTTTLVDHHASPNCVDGSLDIIADVIEGAGLRGVLCYEVTDRDGPEKAMAGIDENVRFLEAAKERPMLGASFGLHAGMTISEETLAACVEAAEAMDSGFHIHVAEHEADEYDSLQKYGKPIVRRLFDAGVLGGKTIVAHAVHCDPWELGLLRETGTWVTHQPRSNMNNAVGAAQVDAMLNAGMRLCLGTDGFSSNMWAEWKAAYLLQKVVYRDPRRAPGDGIAKMALENNARLVEVFFPGQVFGKIVQGAVADLVIVDYYPFTPLTSGNLPWHIIFGFEASMVRTTIVAGCVLMRDRQLLTIDERAVAAKALEHAPDLWSRYQEFAEATL